MRYDKIIDSGRSANANLKTNYNLCKFYFSNRVLNRPMWNYVPTYVASANTLMFKSKDLLFSCRNSRKRKHK